MTTTNAETLRSLIKSPIFQSLMARRVETQMSGSPKIYRGDGGQHEGAMIALFVPMVTAIELPIPKDGLPPNELHITLAHLGKADELEDVGLLHDIALDLADDAAPLIGEIQGVGRFCQDGEQDDVFFLIPDLPALPHFRERLVQRLSDYGFPVSTDHGYVPHITLSYIKENTSIPFDQIAKIPVEFSEISVVLAGERFDYPLVGQRSFVERVGARHTRREYEFIQQVHDLSVKLGARCHDPEPVGKSETNGAISNNNLTESLQKPNKIDMEPAVKQQRAANWGALIQLSEAIRGINNPTR